MSTFFINWQDPETRTWYAVAKMIQVRDLYLFAYTLGSRYSRNFLPFGNMTDVNSIYLSDQLFPMLANRVMSERRPEFGRYAIWSGFDPASKPDPLMLMATMGGGRATDTLQVYPVPERNADRKYRTTFFSHGIRHLPEISQSQIWAVRDDDKLYPMLDVQNPYDGSAVALRTSDPATLIGYVPRYLAQDISVLARHQPNSLVIRVKRLNVDAPAQFRVLCEAVSFWPHNFEPCGDDEHQPIVQFDPSEIISDFEQRRSFRSASIY